MLLEVRGALTAEQIEERTKHSAAAGTPLAEALRASAKVDALDDGSFRYKVRRGGAEKRATSVPAGPGAAASCGGALAPAVHNVIGLTRDGIGARARMTLSRLP